VTAVGTFTYTHTNRVGEETAFARSVWKRRWRRRKWGGVSVRAKGTVQRARERSTVGRCGELSLQHQPARAVDIRWAGPQEILTNCLTRVRQICGHNQVLCKNAVHEQRPDVSLPLTCSVVTAVGPAQRGEEDVSIVQSSAGQAAKHVSLTSRRCSCDPAVHCRHHYYTTSS
jgi:hypothetical protein